MQDFIGENYYTQAELESFPFKRIGKNVMIKKNVGIFYPRNIILSDNVRIEDFSLIIASQEECFFGTNVHIASHSVLLAKSGLEMKDFSGLSPHCIIITASDDYTGEKLTNLTIPKQFRGGAEGKVVLGKHVIIGARTTIFPSVTIGVGTAVGAHSLVRKDLDEWGVYAGNPLRYIMPRKKDLLSLEQQLNMGN